MKVKLKKITNCKSTKRNIYNINKFSGKRICEKYKCKIENNLKENQDNNYKTSTETIKQLKYILSDASVEVLGSMKSTSKPWFNKICKEAIRRRKVLSLKVMKSSEGN